MGNNNSFLPRENGSVSLPPRGVYRHDWLAAGAAGPRQDKVSLWRAAQSRLCPAGLRRSPSPAARPVPSRGGGGRSIPEAAGTADRQPPEPRAPGPAMLLWERRRAPPGAARGSPRPGRSRSVASPSPTALLLLLLLPGSPTAPPAAGPEGTGRDGRAEAAGGRTGVFWPAGLARGRAGTTRPAGGEAARMEGRTRAGCELVPRFPPARAGGDNAGAEGGGNTVVFPVEWEREGSLCSEALAGSCGVRKAIRSFVF